MAISDFDLVLFGGTGDLAMRKLLPALYARDRARDLVASARIICLGRDSKSKEEFIEVVEQQSKPHIHRDSMDPGVWQRFCSRLEYVSLNAKEPASYQNLAATLRDDPAISRVFYLATPPTLFSMICDNLSQSGLATANSRVVLEKPLGHDLASAKDINAQVGRYFNESQIYRIDHYLGKESVQNLMAIRFGNTLFEALWRRQWISSIQITIAESLGVGSRGEFYNKTGALRDMLQNHLLQLLCIVAMEPPFSLDADTVRNEKLKVLQSLKPFTAESVANNVVRGQYKTGMQDGSTLKGYLEEDNIPAGSDTETFVALKAEIQNWRWAGVPFYLRTGKRLRHQMAEIVIQFKDLPCQIFPFNANNFANRLIIKLQPEETVQLYFLAKRPGDTNELSPVYLDLDFAKMFKSRRTEGYERLLLDVIRGKLTLFVRRDEQAAAWKWVEPILEAWEHQNYAPKLYGAGTWGPAASSALLAREGSSWHEELL